MSLGSRIHIGEFTSTEFSDNRRSYVKSVHEHTLTNAYDLESIQAKWVFDDQRMQFRSSICDWKTLIKITK